MITGGGRKAGVGPSFPTSWFVSQALPLPRSDRHCRDAVRFYMTCGELAVRPSSSELDFKLILGTDNELFLDSLCLVVVCKT